MVKFISFFVIVAMLFIFYSDGLKPYFNALSETSTLLSKAGITIEKSTWKANKEKSIEVLKTQCKHGFVRVDERDFRCASDSAFSFFK